MVVEGVYENGIVRLKNKVKVPDKSAVFVIFKDRKSKGNFMKAAGSWKDMDTKVFDEILSSRKNLRERNIKF